MYLSLYTVQRICTTSVRLKTWDEYIMRCMIEIDRGICVGWDVIGWNETNDICPFSLLYVSDYTMISVTVLFL